MGVYSEGMDMATKKESVKSPAIVDKLVLDQLGTPPNFHSIQSVNVFGDYWRVNIRISNSDNPKVITTSLISDSFLVKISKNKIAESHPEITQLYKS